jgi:pantetheine-phosphate adenylyltransferase
MGRWPAARPKRMTTALYPGSFDPITLGHLDVIERAAGVFDRLVVGVLVNPRKSPLLQLDERIAAIREAADEELGALASRVEVASFDGLTIDFAHKVGAAFIVRGLRAVSDFESELQMAHTNRKLAPDVDTMFFMTALEHAYLSSSLVKEIAQFGGDVSRMVPPSVVRRLSG